MSDFDNLKGLDKRLYRGLSAPAFIRMARSVGVGPLRELVAAALKKQVDLGVAFSEHLITQLCQTSKASGLEISLLGLPRSLPASDRLQKVVEQIPEAGLSALQFSDHVMSDFDKLLSPDVSRTADSVTSDPRVAILYAYGILTDPYFGNEKRKIRFYRGKPSDANGGEPTIALLDADAKAADITSQAFGQVRVAYARKPETNRVWSKPVSALLQRFSKQATEAEALRRLKRDRELLLNATAAVEKLVSLPRFNVNNKKASLDAAAKELCEQGLATV